MGLDLLNNMDKLLWPIEKLKPWEKNPRLITKENFERLKAQVHGKSLTQTVGYSGKTLIVSLVCGKIVRIGLKLRIHGLSGGVGSGSYSAR